MSKSFKFRTATKDDREKVQHLFIHSIVNEKNIFSPNLVSSGFLEDFVNKIIDQGNMIIVENENQHVELIGEVHYYTTTATSEDKNLKELVFFSQPHADPGHEKELVEWLYSEIENKHSDVFSVGISTPVSDPSSIDLFMQKGIRIKGNYSGRMKHNSSRQNLFLPLKWINPSFN
jgi:hypothetical protein